MLSVSKNPNTRLLEEFSLSLNQFKAHLEALYNLGDYGSLLKKK